MKTRLLSILLTLCMVLALVPATTITASAAVGGYFTANINVGGPVSCTFRVLTEDAGSSTGTVQIGDGTVAAVPINTEGELIIPLSVSNEGITYTVTKIGDYAFRDCTALTSLDYDPASGITSIGDYAFYQCSGLTGTLDIPSTVTSIGNYAFAYCSSASAINFCSEDTLTSIGEGAFYDCSGLTGVSIPDSVTEIEASAFESCSALAFVELHGNTLPSTMGADVFKYCDSFNKLIVPATWTGGNSVTLPGIAFLPFTGNKLIKDAGLDSVLGEALSTPAGGAGAAAGTPITWSIDVANDVTQVALEDIDPSTGSTAFLYSDADFTANEDQPISLTEDGATIAYIKATGGNVRGDGTTTVRYHAVTINREGDDVAPSGYSISIDQGTINNANKDSLSFTFAGAEVDATYNYTVTSSGGAGSVTGNGTINSATEKITGTM